MHIEQTRWGRQAGWVPARPGSLGPGADLVLVFAAGEILKDRSCLEEVMAAYPRARVIGCSTAGEIYDTEVTDDSLVCTAVSFEHTQVAFAQVSMDEAASSFEAGARLARALD